MRRTNKRDKDEDMKSLEKLMYDENKSMLTSIETVQRVMKDSELKPEFIEAIEDFLTYISDLQDITPTQALLLSIIVEESLDGNVVTISRLARFLDCSKVRVMQFQDDIDDLVKRKFLRRTKKKYGNDGVGYVVSSDAITAINKDGIQFFQMFFDLTHLRKEEEIDTELLVEEFEQLLEANGELRFVKKLEKQNLPINSRLIVTQMARHLVLSQNEHVSVESLGYLFDDRHEAYNEIHPLEEGNHLLIRRNIVEYAGKMEFLNRSMFRLTASAREKLLKGFSLPKDTETTVSTIKAEGIVEKSLFFNDKVGLQMENLSKMLTVEKLTAIQTRLNEHGRRTGFACLFYGAPGTGKTESVLQIAHKTGRDIMQVDMSEIKSKWVGESEQNIKAVFDNYRSLCKACDRTPILLFNEADAILGTRMGKALHSVDKMNNAIQNIVLQEMETFDGIMIATTNLEQSLDGAFERRFLYKIRFERPDVEQRKKIWQSMLPTLSDDTALQLATSYDFSGGQIENIVRKCDVESILYGESSVDAAKIQRFCQEETILKKDFPRIGFY